MASCEEHARPHFTFIWTLENVTEMTYLDFTSPSFVADAIDACGWCLVLWERKGKILCRPCKSHVYCDNTEDCGDESVEIEYETAIITANGSVLNEKRQKKRLESICYNLLRLSSGVGENMLLKEKDKSNLKGILTIRCRMWKPGNESCEPGFCFAHSRLKQERRYFTWSIPEFSSLAIGQRRTFHLQITPKGDFLRVLDLYLQCDDGEDKVYIEKPKKFPYELFCKISVVDAGGNVACSKFISDDAALINLSKLMSNKTLYLPNDVLYLRCECQVDFGVVSNRIENYKQFSMPTSSHIIGTAAMTDDWSEKVSCCPCCCPLKKVVKKYYENGKLTDINLRAGNEIVQEKQRDENLKSEALMFILQHDSEILSSDDWKNFKKKNPMLAMDAMQYVYCLRRAASVICKKVLEERNSVDSD
ncbi:hypothetical protein AVEN_260191-1 [Araneus ventricosus]|uniref:MATH domain-containing protein n=1 Tax=Araneus ventricosus TaxID=182803 RepID=A0A4Y2DNW0_ARAVE|nr:hypothetical protein AVEN_260191-1 [Araneus ventricosus]